MSKFFINRPIFAWVLAIGIMLAGLFAIKSLPIAQYPDVAPPTININATYPGASAETIQNSVTQILEQQLTGLDGLLYFSSTSTDTGSATITATFEKGTDPDTAQVQVQNKIQQAITRLPQSVQDQGVTVAKANSDFLMVVSIYDEKNKATNTEIADYLTRNLQDPLSRINGVGSSRVFGSGYAMRIWLDPNKLSSYSLMPSDVVSAITAQNVEVSAGALGALPSVAGQRLYANVKAKSKLQTVEQFRNIVVKSSAGGSIVHLSDVARVELGQENYSSDALQNGHPASGIALQLAPGADALKTGDAVKAKVAELSKSMPDGYKIAYPRDSTTFIKISIEEVAKTLFEAIALVVVVMFVFLQNWRATLIPALAVPVVLLGTFGSLAVLGYSINTLTMFAMVLAIGLLVDDAIVVVENVDRIMEEEGLSPKEATIKSMGEIGSALVGIAVVLSAVLLPMAFMSGSTGVIYRQFSVTIVSAMTLSVAVALIFTPALCATILKPPKRGEEKSKNLIEKAFGTFNNGFTKTTNVYVKSASNVIGKRGVFFAVYALICVALGFLFVKLPSSFLPTEDQGQVMISYSLPAGATFERTQAVRQEIIKYVSSKEKDNIDKFFAIIGFSFMGQGQNTGLGFAALKPWDERTGKDQSAKAITGRIMGAMSKLRDATIIAMTPPAISGLGQSSGFTFELLNSANLSDSEFSAIKDKIIAAANKDPKLTSVRSSTLPDTPKLQVNIDDSKVAALSLAEANVNSTLSYAWGGAYINDFVNDGKVQKVYVQADAPFRANPDNLSLWHVKNSNNTMTPFSAFATTGWSSAPSNLSRFNGISSYEIQGEAAEGASSGEAMDRMEAIQKEIAPNLTYAWSGLSYQEKLSGNQAPMLYLMSIVVVFLCLAALYESWSIPIAVLLVIPLGVIGAVLFVTLRGLENNIYFQVGLLTTIGLSAKNAILIIEFAEASLKSGKGLIASALEAARLRLRPIIMTSLAFVVGVLPLAIATGAGANSRIAIGTAVLGGTLTSTFLAIFFVPMFYVIIAAIFKHGTINKDELKIKNDEQVAQ